MDNFSILCMSLSYNRVGVKSNCCDLMANEMCKTDSEAQLSSHRTFPANVTDEKTNNKRSRSLRRSLHYALEEVIQETFVYSVFIVELNS